MRYYHTCDDGPHVLEFGFRDSEDVQIGDRVARGVWLSDRPMPVSGANEAMLEVELPADVVARFETPAENPREGRTFLVPASVANRARGVNLTS